MRRDSAIEDYDDYEKFGQEMITPLVGTRTKSLFLFLFMFVRFMFVYFCLLMFIFVCLCLFLFVYVYVYVFILYKYNNNNNETVPMEEYGKSRTINAFQLMMITYFATCGGPFGIEE